MELNYHIQRTQEMEAFAHQEFEKQTMEYRQSFEEHISAQQAHFDTLCHQHSETEAQVHLAKSEAQQEIYFRNHELSLNNANKTVTDLRARYMLASQEYSTTVATLYQQSEEKKGRAPPENLS